MITGFWPRLCCAVVCWFVSMIALIITVAHYTPPIPLSAELWMKLLLTVVIGIGVIAALVAVLAFWLWIWVRKYWS